MHPNAQVHFSRLKAAFSAFVILHRAPKLPTAAEIFRRTNPIDRVGV
jgi:hypothetical protein